MKNNINKLFLTIVVGFVLTFIISLFYGFVILPRLNRNIVCIQSLSRSCFLGTPVCFNFPNPCVTPPLWFPTQSSNLDFWNHKNQEGFCPRAERCWKLYFLAVFFFLADGDRGLAMYKILLNFCYFLWLGTWDTLVTYFTYKKEQSAQFRGLAKLYALKKLFLWSSTGSTRGFVRFNQFL